MNAIKRPQFDRIAEEIKIRELRRAAVLPTSARPVRERRSAMPATKAEPDLTPQLEAAFRAGGMSEAEAKIAARGRARRSAQTLFEAAIEGGMSKAQAAMFARGRGLQEVVKNVAGLPASCFAWVPDPEDSATWKLQISRSAGVGAEWVPDQDLVKAAVAQVPGIAGYDNALDIPAADLAAVKATLYSAWIACNLPIDDMPKELTQEALRRTFIRGGLSEKAAAIAAAGRGRS